LEASSNSVTWSRFQLTSGLKTLLRRLRADRGGQQRRRHLRPGPDPGAVDGDQPVVADLLAGQQAAHDLDALAQPGVADVLARPHLAGDVLVAGLAGAQGGPEAARVHRAQRGSRLGDDRRVVALTRRVDDAERQARRLQGGAQPGPGEGRLALPLAPGREVVGAHGGGEADLLRQLGGGDELAGMDLLVRGVEAEDRHG
jgi:hypothetical protein